MMSKHLRNGTFPGRPVEKRHNYAGYGTTTDSMKEFTAGVGISEGLGKSTTAPMHEQVRHPSFSYQTRDRNGTESGHAPCVEVSRQMEFGSGHVFHPNRPSGPTWGRAISEARRSDADTSHEWLALARPIYVCRGCGTPKLTHHWPSALCSDCWLALGSPETTSRP